MSTSHTTIAGSLGGHPARAALVRMLAAFVAVLVLGAQPTALDRKLGGSAIFLGLAALVLTVSLGFDRLFAAFGNSGLFQAAVEAVARGELRADYVIRSPVCSGIAVLDTEARRVFVNGHVIGFDALVHASVRSGKRRHWLDIAGEGVNERIEFPDRAQAERAAALVRAVALRTGEHRAA